MDWALTKKMLITPYFESMFMYSLTGMEKSDTAAKENQALNGAPSAATGMLVLKAG